MIDRLEVLGHQPVAPIMSLNLTLVDLIYVAC